MAVIGMSDIKKNVRLVINDVPYKVVEFQHVKPGKGAAFVRMKVKSFLNGKVVEKTVHAGDKFEVPDMKHALCSIFMMMVSSFSLWITILMIR
jgi:elongation factor P